MNYNQIAKDIITNVGGSDNIRGLTHCFTRLRFELRDTKKAKKEVIGQLEGVISVVSSMFTPMVPAIAASGLLKGLLTIARITASNHRQRIYRNGGGGLLNFPIGVKVSHRPLRRFCWQT
ncbi:PTS transporter subunit EIIB [Lacrimispora celerecrescens]|uniref:PTS transporter subunit EIIB n=1 Tax=Lacrimispora celerecrescens TaxID=29354 RepID=UPI0016452051|nr:PTS transporter subunit EIIB [Lacrimispora celerecrescens]